MQSEHRYRNNSSRLITRNHFLILFYKIYALLAVCWPLVKENNKWAQYSQEMREERSFGCESIKQLAISKPCSTCPSPSQPHPLSCLPGYHQSWRLGEAKQMTAAELQVLQTVQGQSAPFQTTSGGKNALQFLSVHLVFAKRPHTVHSFKIILWDSKGYFLAMMIYGAASAIRALFEETRWGQVALSGSEMLCLVIPVITGWMSAAGC